MKYPQTDRTVSVFIIVLITLSAILFIRIPKHETPDLTWRLGYVTTRFPGASAEKIESDISTVLEEFLQEVDEIKQVTSVSRRGVSLLQIELLEKVSDAPPVWQKVQDKLDKARLELPDGALAPILDDEVMGTVTWLIGISSAETSLPDIVEHIERLEESIRYLPFVADTTILGSQTEIVYIDVDPAKMAASEVSFDSFAHALRHRTPSSDSATMPSGSQRISVDGTHDFEQLDDIRSALISSPTNNETIRVRDMAVVNAKTVDPMEPLVRVNGEPSVLLSIRAQRHRGNRANRAALAGLIEQFNRMMPNDLKCRVLHDESYFVSRRMRQLSLTLGCGLLLVLATSTVFMGWRSGVSVALTIPITGLISIAILYCVGITLQQMSVMAIIMSFGMLVDDAIIFAEHIQHQKGVKATTAAKRAVRELIFPMLTTTLTTVVAFLPIFLLPGGTGEFVRSIPIVVAICLFVALAVSVTIVPRVVVFLSKEAVPLENNWFDRFIDYFRNILVAALKKPIWVCLGTTLFFLILATSRLGIRRDFFSPVERNQFLIDVYSDPGSSLEHTQQVVQQIEAVLQKENLIDDVLSFVGRNAPQVFYNLYSQETYSNDFAQLVVRTSDFGKTPEVAERIQKILNQTISEALCTVRILEHGAPLSAPIEVRTQGRSLEVIHEVSRRALELLKDTPGIRNIRTDSGWSFPRLRFELNAPIAKLMGVTHETVASHLRYVTDGIEAGYLRQDDERIPIRIRFAPSKHSPTGLRAVSFKTQDGLRWIPISVVGRQHTQWEISRIHRRDGMRTETVTAYPAFGFSAAQVTKRCRGKLSELGDSLPSGYTLELGGENEQREMAESELARNAVFSALIIICLLVWEFKHLRLVFLILALVPLSFCGAMFGLWLTGWPLNFMAVMGMLILAGILVNDAVILLDGYERERHVGRLGLREIIIEKTIDRTRHVIVTTATTVMGLIPLATSKSLLWPPLAIVIIFGLLSSTILTLILVPVIYSRIMAAR